MPKFVTVGGVQRSDGRYACAKLPVAGFAVIEAARFAGSRIGGSADRTGKVDESSQGIAMRPLGKVER